MEDPLRKEWFSRTTKLAEKGNVVWYLRLNRLALSLGFKARRNREPRQSLESWEGGQHYDAVEEIRKRTQAEYDARKKAIDEWEHANNVFG